MGEAENGKDPVDLYPAERVAQGWATLAHQAEQESEAPMEGGSAKMQSQSGPKTE